jgi:hypothetical protein
MDTEKVISELLNQSRNLLDDSSCNEISRYLESGEHEMAYEGLLVELVKTDRYPKAFNIEVWKSVGEACELDSNGGVFDYEIWPKFLHWASGSES